MPTSRTIRKREQRIRNAIEAVKRGETVRNAAEQSRIPKITLQYRLTTPMKAKRGRPTALSVIEEQMILDFIIRHANKGIPMTEPHLCEAISVVLGRLASYRRMTLPFERNKPSPGYLRAFRKRHAKVIKFRKPLRQEAKRFRAVNVESLTTHFATVEKLIAENNIDAARMFNLDEVGVTPKKDASGKLGCKRLMSRNSVQDFITCDFSYENRITMMPVINAAGDCGPPLFVIKGKRVPYRTFLRDGGVFSETPLCKLPRHAVLATRSEGGGVDRANFISWALRFVDYTKDLPVNGRKVLLIYDAYRSHISLEVLEVFLRNDILVYALPAHTSGKTQPLDVVLFSAFKEALNKTVSSCSGFGDGKALDLFDVCSVMRTAYDQAFTRCNVSAGFRRAGLWPLDGSRLLNMPRPASAVSGAPILSVEGMEKAYEDKRLQLRTGILGRDAKMLNCGYVNTANGCVMTSGTVLDLMRKKEEELKRKSEKERMKAAGKELKAAKRRSKALLDVERMRQAQLCTRAELAGLSVEEFSSGVRSLKERRAVAKMRVLNKRAQV